MMAFKTVFATPSTSLPLTSDILFSQLRPVSHISSDDHGRGLYGRKDKVFWTGRTLVLGLELSV